MQRDVLPDGTVVPAGAQVVYSPYVVNRLAGVWGADALAFRPERWLEMDKAPSPYAYLTFNAGGCGGGNSSRRGNGSRSIGGSSGGGESQHSCSPTCIRPSHSLSPVAAAPALCCNRHRPVPQVPACAWASAWQSWRVCLC